MVVIHTQPKCVQCRFAKNYLQHHQIPFQEVDLTTNAKAKANLQKHGWKVTPVIQVGNEWFAGFQPQRLQALVER